MYQGIHNHLQLAMCSCCTELGNAALYFSIHNVLIAIRDI